MLSVAFALLADATLVEPEPQNAVAASGHARRGLRQVTVSTVMELTTAVSNASFGHIILDEGTYFLTHTLVIHRDLVLDAKPGGLVVLDGRSSHRVLKITNALTVHLNGLHIRNGHTSDSVNRSPFLPLLPSFAHLP